MVNIRKLLIVEDELIFRRTYEIAFNETGFEITFAENEIRANEILAVEMLNSEHFHAIVIDVMLHKAGGKRNGGIILAREIRELERKKNLPRIPIIFTTVLGEDFGIREIIEQERLSDQEILTKPFPPTLLINMLRNL